MGVDLSRYFARIGYEGPATASRETLDAISVLHPQAIAFENLDPLRGRVVGLDLEALQAKLLDAGRGGYCFEHNLLLADVLRTIGFEVTPLAARVLWRAPASARVGPRSHMLLRVDLDGEPLIVDAGFGGVTLTGVLRLRTGVEQSTPHEPFRLIEHRDTYRMEVRIDDQWVPLYRFDLQPQEVADYEVSSWFLCTNPMSPFTRVLMAARTFAGGRHALRDNVWTKYEAGKTKERVVLTEPQALAEVLTDAFGIALPEGDEMPRLLADLAARREA